MNVLYVASEVSPFAKTGGLADVAGSLPKALLDSGVNARVIMPLYSTISQKYVSQMEYLFNIFVPLGWRRQYCGLFKLEQDGITYYFVDNEYYFRRAGLYGYYDDAERYSFFSKAVVALLPMLSWRPDVISCNDWQTALVPIYLHQEKDKFFYGIKTLFTIHNIEYQGSYSSSVTDDVFGLPWELYSHGILRFGDSVNLMKGAICDADYVTTVSEGYSHELHDPYFASGLHEIIQMNSDKFSGIINGIDTKRYDSATDELIPKNFSISDLSGKKECKIELCRMLGLDETDDSPIIACVSRLVGHKGFDLVANSIDKIVESGARLVILGTGDSYYENVFRDAENWHKGRVSASIMYNEKRAMAIYAGADMILIPSKSEPCGLTQMIAMRYGTIPIVRAVGGLGDSVRNYDRENSNGFSFWEFSEHGMMGAIHYALDIYKDIEAWESLMVRAMSEDLSWSKSAEKYKQIYQQLLNI